MKDADIGSLATMLTPFEFRTAQRRIASIWIFVEPFKSSRSDSVAGTVLVAGLLLIGPAAARSLLGQQDSGVDFLALKVREVGA